MVAKLETIGFFGYSNIYSYCLQQLTSFGNFTQNLGSAIFYLNSWSSLVPFFIVVVGLMLFFFNNDLKAFLRMKHSTQNSVGG
jgi:hypothetical protein